MVITDDINSHCDFIKENYLKYKDIKENESDATKVTDSFATKANELINAIKKSDIYSSFDGDLFTENKDEETKAITGYSLNYTYNRSYQCFDDILIDSYTSYNNLKELSKVIKDLLKEYNDQGHSFTYQKPSSSQSTPTILKDFHDTAEDIYTTTTKDNTKAKYYYRSFKVFLEAISSAVNTVLFHTNRVIFEKILTQVKTKVKEIKGSDITETGTILDDLNKLSVSYESIDPEINIVKKIINDKGDNNTTITMFNEEIIKPLGSDVHSFLNHLHNTSATLKSIYQASTSNYKNEYENTRKKLGEINDNIKDNLGDIRSLKEVSKQIKINERYYTGALYTIIAVVVVCCVIIGMSLNANYDAQVALLYTMIGVLIVFYLIYTMSMKFLVNDLFEGFSDASSSSSTSIDTLLRNYMSDTLISLETSSSNSFYVNTVMPSMKNEQRKYDTLRVKSVSSLNKHKLFNNESLHSINKNKNLIDLIVGLVISTIISYIIFLTFPSSTFLVVSTTVVLFTVFLAIYAYQTQKRSNTSYRHMYFTK